MTNSKDVLTELDIKLPGQSAHYSGKVREVFTLEDGLVAIVATDRLSAFDNIMPVGIPYKGQVLNQIAYGMMQETTGIVPNWILGSPDPNVTIGHKCEPIKIEMVIRATLTGHAWREYRSGKRELCGVRLPDGLSHHDRFAEPIVTPTTKADAGHDEDISREEILDSGLLPEEDYDNLERITRELFDRGSQLASGQGLILADTKYEFGTDRKGNLRLIDEVHTPDSSRYFYKEGFGKNESIDSPPRQLSKEFFRQWLIDQGYQGRPGDTLPTMTADIVDKVSERYIELYERLLGVTFEPSETGDKIQKRILANVDKWLNNYRKLQ